MRNIRILALSGSLRKASYNTAAIEAMQALVPDNIEISNALMTGLKKFCVEIKRQKLNKRVK